MVIAAQAFQATPRAHAPAVVIGLLPGIAAWVSTLIQSTLRAGAETLGKTANYPPDILAKNWEGKSGTFLPGVLALDQGAIFTATILAAMTVALIERKHIQAGLWSLLAAGLSATGFMHRYVWNGAGADNVIRLGWTDWSTGYAIMAACFFLAPVLTEPGEGH
jgi:AGZA family xanthine/uracil permease-like MFS transporter